MQDFELDTLAWLPDQSITIDLGTSLTIQIIQTLAYHPKKGEKVETKVGTLIDG